MTNFYKKIPSSLLAFILSFFPGLGLMYLGAKKRGFQLTLIACLALTFQSYSGIFNFIFIIAMIYSVFDTLEKIRILKETNKIVDNEIFDFHIIGDKRKTIGVALIILGCFYFLRQLAFLLFDNSFFTYIITNVMDATFRGAVLIIIGLFLLKGSKLPAILKKEETVYPKTDQDNNDHNNCDSNPPTPTSDANDLGNSEEEK